MKECNDVAEGGGHYSRMLRTEPGIHSVCPYRWPLLSNGDMAMLLLCIPDLNKGSSPSVPPGPQSPGDSATLLCSD